MAKLRTLSEAAIEEIREIVRLERERTTRTRGQRPDADELWTPEVYLAYTPADGVPGGVPSGTGSDVGAECAVYRRIGNQRVPIQGLTRICYNVNEESIPGNKWVLAKRDKWDTWWVESTSAEDDEGVPGNGPGGGPCSLAALGPNDCIKATGPSNWVLLQPNGDRSWTSADADTGTAYEELEYLGCRGTLVAEWNSATGLLDLFLDGLILMNCGNGCYTGGPLTGHYPCAGTGSPDPCDGETFTVCLECRCCPISGWTRPAFYCAGDATGTGTGTDDCEAVFISEEDSCDDTVYICSGPYDSFAECAAICGVGTGTGTGTAGLTLPECDDLPASLTIAIVGNCAGAGWSGPMTEGTATPPADRTWSSSFPLACAYDEGPVLTCQDGTWRLTINGVGSCSGLLPVAATANSMTFVTPDGCALFHPSDPMEVTISW